MNSHISSARLPAGKIASGFISLLGRHAALVTVLAMVSALYLIWTWNDSIGQLGGDGGSYLMMAQHYSPYGNHDQVYAEAATFSRFPPLYPLLLAWTNSANHLITAHVVTTVCLLLALTVLYGWALSLDLGRARSALPVFLFAMLPGTWLLGLMIQSEYLYLCLSLTALWLMSAWRRHKRDELLYGAALAVSAAVLTRSIGVALLPALACVTWGIPKRKAGLTMLLAVFSLVAWHFVHRSPSDYTEVLREFYGHGGIWKALRPQLATELPALWSGFVGNFTQWSNFQPLAAIVCAAALAAAAVRFAQCEPDGVYVMVNLAVLAIWPFPEEAQRFMWVLLPILLVQVLLVTGAWKQRPVALTIAPTALAGATLLLTAPAVVSAVHRHRAGNASDIPQASSFVEWYGENPEVSRRNVATQISIINAMRMIDQDVPADDCVVSIRPDLIDYYGRRRSVFAPLDSIPDPYFMAALKSTGCHYTFVIASPNSRYPIPMHPLQRLGSAGEVLYVSTYDDAASAQTLPIAALARIRY